jgi:hypothetical protein
MFRFWRLLLKIDNVVLIVLKVFLAEVVNDWLPILLLFMRAFVSTKRLEIFSPCGNGMSLLSKIIRSRECFVAKLAYIWSLLGMCAHVSVSAGGQPNARESRQN